MAVNCHDYHVGAIFIDVWYFPLDLFRRAEGLLKLYIISCKISFSFLFKITFGYLLRVSSRYKFVCMTHLAQSRTVRLPSEEFDFPRQFEYLFKFICLRPYILLFIIFSSVLRISVTTTFVFKSILQLHKTISVKLRPLSILISTIFLGRKICISIKFDTYCQ